MLLISQLSLEDICLSFCRDTALEILALRQQGGGFLPCLTTKILRIYSSRFNWYINSIHKCHDERVVNPPTAVQRGHGRCKCLRCGIEVAFRAADGKAASTENRLTGRPPSTDRQSAFTVRCRKESSRPQPALCSLNSGGTADYCRNSP